jgi:CHAD domain-containing protein
VNVIQEQPAYEPKAVDFPELIDQPANPEWELGIYAQHNVLTYFRQMLSERTAVLDNVDIEGVHQIRVAARRCRTALQTYTVLWDVKDVKRYRKYLGNFADVFGVARDLDVLLVYLREQLESAEGERRTALNWLLARNQLKRDAEQPHLVEAIRQLDAEGFPEAFVTYFATQPTDLWALEVDHG